MNPRQRLRERSIKSLTHPFSVGAIILLLINDHWLRWHYPSWWTGKIGDIAWLIFAPFLLIFILSIIWPKNKIDWVGLVAFIGTGLLFILGNTVPFFHHKIVWLFQQIAGWKPFMVLDPSDLLTLPSLWIGWKIWETSKTKLQRIHLPPHKHFLGWILLSIGALGTLANQPSLPDYGVYCVAQHGKTILAVTGSPSISEEGWFESSDGGLTWTHFNNDDSETELPCSQETIPWEIVSPENPDLHWRIQEASKFIEQSRDDGQNWRTVYEFPAGKQVRKYYYRPETPFLTDQIKPGGPYNGIVDPKTSNLIVSMGFEGVVVASPTGEVKRIAVGPYSFVDINALSLAERLNKELLLAAILFFLVVSIGSIPVWTKSRSRILFLIGVSGETAVWLIYALFFRETGILVLVDFAMFSIYGWFFFIMLASVALNKILENHPWQLAGQIFTAATASSILFLIPMIFWATGTLQSYQLGSILSILLAAIPIRHIFRLVSQQSQEFGENH